MRRALRYASIPLLALTFAAQAGAGTVYVPHPGPVQIGEVEYEAQIWASNSDPAEIRRIEHLFIPTLTDGTERSETPTLVRIPPGVTTRLEFPDDSEGLLEIFAAPQVAITARMVRKVPGVVGPPSGAQLPVISSDNAAEAGETIHLQGWERFGERVSSNFGLVNLGDSETQCEIGVFRSDGSQIGPTVLLRFKPRSHAQFDRALGILNAGDVRDVRSEVTCDQPFYAYVSIYYQEVSAAAGAPGDVVFVEPSASGKSDLSRPAEEGEFVYLDELSWVDTQNVRNGPHKNVSGWDPHAGRHGRGGYKPIEINGVRYERGISWFPGWGDSSVAWSLDGEYRRFTATVRIDDEKDGEYEWALVDRQTGEFIRLQRPPGGFRAQEAFRNFRVGAGARIRIYGDGQLLFESEEFHAYGPAVQVDLDVTGVGTLLVELLADHRERAGAPHRAGLPSPPALVRTCSWFDLIDLADAKLFPVQ